MTAQFISQHSRRRNQRAALCAVMLGAGAAALALVAASIWLIRLLAPLPDQPIAPTPSRFPPFEGRVSLEEAPPAASEADHAKARPRPRPRPAKTTPAPEIQAPQDPFAGVEVLEPHELATISQAH